MIIKDQALLREFSGLKFCEGCGQQAFCEPHHITKRGMGGGSRLDVRWNIVALGGAFFCGCHKKADAGQITKDTLYRVVASREGKTLLWVKNTIKRLLRAPKRPK